MDNVIKVHCLNSINLIDRFSNKKKKKKNLIDRITLIEIKVDAMTAD